MGSFDSSAFAAEQRLRELEAVGSIGSWRWDIQRDRVSWSDQLFEIFGLKPDEFDATYEGYLSTVHPDDRDFAQGVIERSLETLTPWEADYRIVQPSGSERWIHSRGRIMLDEDERPVRVVGTCQDITEQRRILYMLVDQATVDPLTSLVNRWVIVDRLHHALERAQRHGVLPAVLFIDLDGLKLVNDNLGHAAGDEVLRQAAEAIVSSVRTCDSVGRFGGDEFLVVCEDVSPPAEGPRIARRIVDQLRIAAGDATSGIVVTSSVGVTVASPDESADAVIARADSAMYEAKQRGGGQLVARQEDGD